MARVGIIVVSYRTDPEPLFASVAPSRHDVRWYIFVHGDDPQLRSKLDAFVQTVDARYFPYGINRGLARSWNEGIIASFGDGNDVTIVLNDDLSFYEGGFDAFVDFVLEGKKRIPDFAIAMTYGQEPDRFYYSAAGEKLPKKILTLGSCFSIGQGAVDRVGFFDENIWPAYYEDFDYHYRLELLDAPMLRDERMLLKHERNATKRKDRIISLLHEERLKRCEDYYARKWGGDRDFEIFTKPFNDKTLDCFISEQARSKPYGPKHDRTDLGSAETLGFLEADFTEELLGLMWRCVRDGCRYLIWGPGKAVAVLAEFAKSKGAEFFLAIDDDAARLRQASVKLPKYPFLHFRLLTADEKPDSSHESDADYVSYPLRLGRRFDVVLIAGRCRMDCALLAPGLLAEGGLVILHDKEHNRHQAIRQYVGGETAAWPADAFDLLDRWERAWDRALRELYAVMEQTSQFMVLRPKTTGPVTNIGAE